MRITSSAIRIGNRSTLMCICTIMMVFVFLLLEHSANGQSEIDNDELAIQLLGDKSRALNRVFVVKDENEASARLKILPVSFNLAEPSKEEDEFPDGASLKTDPELQQLLDRAMQFSKDGRLDLAVVLWQKVLDDSTQTVVTNDDWAYRTFRHNYRTYRSVSGEVERILYQLSPADLKIYRVSADGEAKAILAAGGTEKREQALSQVVRRYFLSSLGDDAAFELACLQLDRYDFVGASRNLTKILQEYPDPSISRRDILLRLAVASSRVNDMEIAANAMEQLKKLPNFQGLIDPITLVEQDLVESANRRKNSTAASDDWQMAHGSPSRTGYSRSLPSSMMQTSLSERWVQTFHPRTPTSGLNKPNSNILQSNDLLGGNGFVGATGQLVSNSRITGRLQGFNRIGSEPILGDVFFDGKSLRNTVFGAAASRMPGGASTPINPRYLTIPWQESGWFPTGQLLLHDNRIYYKSQDRLICCDAKTGALLWTGRKNAFRLDEVSRFYAMVNTTNTYNRSGQTISSYYLKRPKSSAEVLFFGDRVHQEMAISDDLIYSLEGPLSDRPEEVPVDTTDRRRVRREIPLRARSNWLVAYEARSGKFRWRRSAHETVEDSQFKRGFLAAPTPHAHLLLVPVSDSGALWAYGLDRDTGEIVWKTFLCDEPLGGCSPWSPVRISVSGGDAYIAGGAGVVLALDAFSGSIRWASRYRRTANTNSQTARYSLSKDSVKELIGWDEDVVIPHGRQLVVLASDCDRIFCLDRRTGKLLWDSPRSLASETTPARYCLGVVGESLFAAGPNTVRRYDIPSGRIVWQENITNSRGRGLLTENAIYLPMDASILQLDINTGKQLASVDVWSASREPVGNLYSDGEQFYAAGLGRVYALTDLRLRLQDLASRIEQDDIQAHLERMRLLSRMNRRQQAVTDLKAAYNMLILKSGVIVANRVLYDSIFELSLEKKSPQTVLRLLAESKDSTSELTKQTRDLVATLRGRRNSLLQAALRQISKSSATEATDDILGVAHLCQQRHLLAAAERTIALVAGPKDEANLLTAVQSDQPASRIIATSGLVAAIDTKATQTLSKMVNDTNEYVRLAVALGLANLGERQSLSMLGKLLDSRDVQIRARADQVLRSLTGQNFNFVAYDDSRRQAARRWEKWISDQGPGARLYFPIQDHTKKYGRTLICNYNNNLVTEIDEAGKITWQIRFNRPWACQGLPNGHRLVVSYNDKLLVEFDADGKEVWRFTGLPGQITSVERLPNGNTLVSCLTSKKVMEIRRDKKVVWEAALPGYVMDAKRLENGNTLACLQNIGTVVEIDRQKKIVWQLPNMYSPRSAQRLPNGNTLVCQYNSGRIVEVDPNNRLVWSKTGVDRPYDASRLDNGNTLIVDMRGVMEVDARGEILWQRKENGIRRVFRY